MRSGLVVLRAVAGIVVVLGVRTALVLAPSVGAVVPGAVAAVVDEDLGLVAAGAAVVLAAASPVSVASPPLQFFLPRPVVAAVLVAVHVCAFAGLAWHYCY